MSHKFDIGNIEGLNNLNRLEIPDLKKVIEGTILAESP